MAENKLLKADFYARTPTAVAIDLLGKRLVSATAEGLVAGRIVETEAYLASGDAACHTARGCNRKNATMFGAAGLGYVYTIHGRHCLNAVTEQTGVGSAVLIRAIQPLAGLEVMRRRRGREAIRDLARGPARLCEAYGITRQDDGLDLTTSERVWICDEERAPVQILCSPRIGVKAAGELPLRFYLAGSDMVSGPKWLNQSGQPLPDVESSA